MAQFDNAADLHRFISRKIRSIRKIRNIIEDDGYGEQAVQDVRDIIETSPRPTSSGEHPGRQDTGFMADHVKTWTVSESEDSKTVAVGWRAEDFAGFRTPSYPVIQDQGFHHVNADVAIPGMEALASASQLMRDDIVRAIRRKLREQNDNDA